jgi:predicted DNA-binding antitoxin AbrB/MazE fold protein
MAIKVGDTVEVVDIGKHYSTFSEWADRHNLKQWEKHPTLYRGLTATVVAVDRHSESVPTTTVLGIQTNSKQYIIGVEGVKLIEGEKMTKYVNRDGVMFEAGDKVKVVRIGMSRDPDGMGPGKLYENAWMTSMDNSLGETFTIKSIGSNGVYFVEDDYQLGYPLNVLEKIKDTPYPELKPFQRVELRNGKKGIIVTDSVAGLRVVLDNGTWTSAEFVKGFSSQHEIVKVFDVPVSTVNMLKQGEHGVLLWKAASDEQIAADKAIEEARNAVEAANVALKAAEEARKALK